MIAITSIFGKNQTTIPKEVRERLGLDDNMMIEWDINKNNEAILKFRKKDCKMFFEKLDKIEKEMDNGNKVTLDVKGVLKENGL
jgi:bifunctional DNA-binding transcriptional regulator/antitoxin component of YhaV-PrlF toxin-antitoxin module